MMIGQLIAPSLISNCFSIGWLQFLWISKIFILASLIIQFLGRPFAFSMSKCTQILSSSFILRPLNGIYSLPFQSKRKSVASRPVPIVGCRGVSHPFLQTNVLSANHQIRQFCRHDFLLFVLVEHKKKNYMVWRNGQLVNLLHFSMKSSRLNRYSSILGTTPIFSAKCRSHTPQEKFLGTAQVARPTDQ